MNKKLIGSNWAIIDKYIRNIENHGFKAEIKEGAHGFFLEISHDNFFMQLGSAYEIEKIALLLDEYTIMIGGVDEN